MHLSRRDLLFIVGVLAILALLFTGTGKKLGTDVPETAEHLVFYQQLEQGGRRIELELGCASCHATSSLPGTHPPKEECMVCHLRR